MNVRILAICVAALMAGAAALAVWQLPDRSHDDVPQATGWSAAPASAPAKQLPAPKGKPVLRLTGVTKGNAGPHTTKLDFATLDDLGREHVTIYEPFLKRKLSFTGIRMSRLLRLVGLPSSASALYMHALDDYHVNLPVGGVASDGFLATRVDGQPIRIAKGGPIRLLFTDDDGLGANTDNWIWSMDRVRARG